MNGPPNRITRVSASMSGGQAGPTARQAVAAGSQAAAWQQAATVLDLTRELVALVARREWGLVARVVLERRRLLERIPEDPSGEDAIGALRAAMAESDRTVGLLLAGAELRWPAGGRARD